MEEQSESNNVVETSGSGTSVSETGAETRTADTTAATVTDEQRNITQLVYILQAVAVVVGLTSIADVIVNYLKRDEVKDTYLESHFNWQIKTFWYTLAGGIVGMLLMVILIGFPILLLVGLWYIYRVVKGWLAFYDGKSLDDGLF